MTRRCVDTAEMLIRQLKQGKRTDYHSYTVILEILLPYTMIVNSCSAGFSPFVKSDKISFHLKDAIKWILIPSAVKRETFIKMKLFEVRVGILEKWVIFLVIGDILGN